MIETAIFAAGCFWNVDSAFRQVKGIISTTVGYTGGTVESPTYKEVCTGKTGHVEAVKVEYNPDLISYKDLLEIFWAIHDPTQLNMQWPDIGTQYRSVIFYLTETQRRLASSSKEKLEKSRTFSRPIVTEILSAKPFYRAEEYHQNYYEKNKIIKTCHFCRNLI
ncbi:MAG: peptide-methionine (S)-S-oxide reductase MsrA [Candidatus Helarchaeota archaeon]